MSRRSRCLLLALVVLVGATPLAAERIVAIGDIHGEIEGLRRILRRAALIDERDRWIGGTTTLVQTGDFLDRGDYVKEVMELLRSLQATAPAQGGRVVVLLGNHEAINLLGFTRDVSANTFARFADASSQARLEESYRGYVKWSRQHAKKSGAPRPTFDAAAKAAFMERYPPGFLNYLEALSPRGELGTWIRSLPTVVRLSDTIFLHAGVPPTLATWSEERINQRVWDEIRDLDACRAELLKHGVIHETADPNDMVAYGMAELNHLLERIPRSAEPFREELKNRVRVLRNCVNYEDWFLIKEDGPLWFRGFARWSDAEGEALVDSLLKVRQAARFVVGHTPQVGTGVSVRFGGRIFLIDTGMLSSVYRGGVASALEIVDGRFTAIYEDRQELLHEAKVSDVRAPATFARWVSGSPGPPRRRWLGADGVELPFADTAELLEFLRSAEIVESKRLKKGINQPFKLTLEQDGVRAHAIFRTVDVMRTRFRLNDRFFPVFRDSYRFEVAAFELGRVLGISAIPPVVLRHFRGEAGSIQLWVENVIDEATRLERGIDPPGVWWVQQKIAYRVFDALIANIDRNAGNLLIDRGDWTIWLIDHTRSFFEHEELEQAELLSQCERGLYAALRTTDRQGVATRLAPYLSPPQIKYLFVRWDLLLEHFDRLIAERGEASVLFDFVEAEPGRRPLRVSVPTAPAAIAGR